MRWNLLSLALLLAASACHSSAPPKVAPTEPPVAIAASAPPVSAPRAIAPTDEHVFRELLGASGLRFTWTLTRSADRVSLKGSCQVRRKNPRQAARPALRIDGNENAAFNHSPDVAMEYEGKPSGGLTYDLARTSASAPGACPHRNFARIRLVCREGDVDALAAGAVLLPATGRQTMATWQPASRKTVRALRCELSENGNPTSTTEDLVTAPELVFSAPGVEWAEAGTKDAAYRFMP